MYVYPVKTDIFPGIEEVRVGAGAWPGCGGGGWGGMQSSILVDLTVLPEQNRVENKEHFETSYFDCRGVVL